MQFAILYIGYAVGNLIGPQTFRENQAPAYTGGVVAMLVSYWAICVFQNRGVVAPAVEIGDEGAAVESFQDITDFKQEGFKYTT